MSINKIKLIKAEIERLKSSLPWGSCASQISMECNCKNEAYNEVLSYIDSLSDTEKDFSIKESVIPFGASDSELMEATYFIPQGYHAVIEGDKVIIKKGEDSVSNDLEEAAREWLKPKLDKSYINYGEAKMMELTHFDGYAMLDATEFGAQWQKKQDQLTIELAEDHAMLAGMEKMKEEMIDKVCKWLAKHWRKYVWLTDNDVIHFGHWKYDLKRAMEE